MPLLRFFVLTSCVYVYVFLRLLKKTSGIEKQLNANGNGICENVCGIYDLIYESSNACMRRTEK